MSLGSMSLFSAALSAALASPPSSEELEVLQAIREADLGLERVYDGIHDYHYAAPPDTPEFEWRGPFLWRYAGQAQFTDLRPASPRAVTVRVPESVLTGIEYDGQEYFGAETARNVDELGRLWVLDYVDLEQVRGKIDEYDRRVVAEFGVEEPGLEPNDGLEFSASTAEFTGTPTSWDVLSCSGDEFYDHDGNGAFVKVSATPLNSVQRKTVWVGHSDHDGCSGTVVDAGWVLTAAHCVTGVNGSELSQTGFTVCSMENLDENITGGLVPKCGSVVNLHVAPGWAGLNNYDVTDDYALLELDTNFGVGWMALSGASDSTFSSHVDFHRGYPESTRQCGTNAIHKDSLTTDDDFAGRHLYRANGSVQGTPAGWVKWDTSQAKGSSGGPHYYCPWGGCSNGHYVTGVSTGNDLSCRIDSNGNYLNPPCSWGYAYGPKARDIRSWVIGHLP